ncbi:unnamed protein product [Allacma fusca]|uniref:Uncharacterized protein n=1 Tax=Allacma fusca TaxID=39272 RepID=A0A8J2PSB9_9HEXA|nr:unnamed protein product [Allacma fusca]
MMYDSDSGVLNKSEGSAVNYILGDFRRLGRFEDDGLDLFLKREIDNDAVPVLWASVQGT